MVSLLLSESMSRLVGMAYYTWHFPARNTCRWGTPSLGNYNSDNRAVMKQHAEWLRDAGVDFIIIDWSNDVNQNPGNNWQGRDDIKSLELNTNLVFEEFKKVKGAPKIAIMTGSPSDANNYQSWTLIQKKLDQVW